jgi:starch synthase
LLLKVLVVASEAFPLAKTGGLGDAVSGMARALHEANVDVTILLPAYPSAMRQVSGVRQVAHLEGMPGGDATLLAGRIAQLDLPVLLLRNDALYDRQGSLYLDANGVEHPDNGLRFAALSHAATRIAAGRTPLPVPHVVHANDWHSGLTPLLMRAAGITRVKSVITIHNLAFQGVYPMEDAASFGIPEEYRGPDGAEYWGKVSFLKAGLRFADRITTVSRNYANEILTPEFGMGLEGVLNFRRKDLLAIPNGIDTDIWDPAIDAFLPDHFSVLDMQGKAACKRSLQESFGLIADPNATVMVSGSRLTHQKMGDVAVDAIPMALDANPHLQVAVLGCGDKRIEDGLRALVGKYPGRMAVNIGYSERLAHLLHAGGDILLHGSRFEPFGLTPIYAMRYGTIPVCSRVGGMADTVVDPGRDAGPHAVSGASGVLFEGDSMYDMLGAIERALALKQHPKLWRAMQKNGMTSNFGWEVPAIQYLEMYRSLAPLNVSIPRPSLSKPHASTEALMRASTVPVAAKTPAKAPATAGRKPAPGKARAGALAGLNRATPASI